MRPCMRGMCGVRWAALMLPAAVAAQGWSGKLVYEITTPEFTTSLLALSDGEAWRYELGEAGDPHTVWLVFPSIGELLELKPLNRAYSVQGTAPRSGDPSMGGRRSPRQPESPVKWESESLGERNLHGLTVSGHRLKTRGADTELWLHAPIEAFPQRFFESYGALLEVAPALRGYLAEHPGLPVQIERKRGRRVQFRLELIAVEAGAVDAAVFEVPEGYELTSGQRGRTGAGRRSGPGPGRGGPGPGAGGGDRGPPSPPDDP